MPYSIDKKNRDGLDKLFQAVIELPRIPIEWDKTLPLNQSLTIFQRENAIVKTAIDPGIETKPMSDTLSSLFHGTDDPLKTIHPKIINNLFWLMQDCRELKKACDVHLSQRNLFTIRHYQPVDYEAERVSPTVIS